MNFLTLELREIECSRDPNADIIVDEAAAAATSDDFDDYHELHRPIFHAHAKRHLILDPFLASQMHICIPKDWRCWHPNKVEISSVDDTHLSLLTFRIEFTYY